MSAPSCVVAPVHTTPSAENVVLKLGRSACCTVSRLPDSFSIVADSFSIVIFLLLGVFMIYKYMYTHIDTCTHKSVMESKNLAWQSVC